MQGSKGDLESAEVVFCRSFILGGNADFSIQNMNNGIRYDYTITKASNNNNIYFVKVKSSKQEGYVYAGHLKVAPDGVYYVQGSKGKLQYHSEPIGGYLMQALFVGDNSLPRPMIMFHHGKCAKCGRKLTDIESIKRGFGKFCYESLFKN